ncbi:hypothetical protein CAS74_003751 [Pichia kudriavzevii]|uniref:Large ribosomal subunit protein mL46 n=1 Tax=Pichia kudriavzevii TaxID=4909 RepID=A0A099P2K3_PICKU|nr:uncharacterized protein C5L36_0B06540 [Pichia kudriavzevii]AWU75409.1 hypothetical protein C5L36_0B06540 [Pichia kudriavzevii]KGK38489.1 hypothetical protein JL09_g2370 [Pichia kudriavzevii]ONH74094.1 hypothetical protein BOH78_2618 [Pichia kudriavzevii]OUT21630.1 hypothetical protein CAS74_003751 [Pichia kudriavzevii]
MLSYSRSFSTTRSASAIKASLILSRTPIVTPDVPEFENAFYNYQQELEKRLMWTFPKWFYFKKGTVAEREFTEAQKYPVPNHRGVWFPKGTPDLKHGRDRRFKQEVILPKRGGVEAEEEDLDDVGRSIRPNPRITKADESNDQSSLERKLPRTLYLLVQDGSGSWKFPSFPSDGKTGLHQTAEEGLRTIGGDKLNTWSVSNSPAAVIKSNDDADFLMKSHIVAGRFEVQKDSNIKDFKWLVKEEIAEFVDPKYYEKISHLISDV